MLRENACIGEIVQIIRAECFYFDAHQTIWRSIVALFQAGSPVDLVLLADRLRQDGRIENVGGYAALGELWDCAPTAANAEYYAAVVRDHAIVRGLIHASTETLRNCYEKKDSAENLLAEAERGILDIAEHGVAGTAHSAAEIMRETYTRIDTRQKSGEDLRGLSTGFVDLDYLTAGLQNGELIVLAARPSIGKTALAANLARNISVKYGQSVFFVSLEQSRVELGERLLSAQARVDGVKLRKGTMNKDEARRVVDAGALIERASLWIDDTSCQTMLRIAANGRRLKLREGLRCVMIDYLQLIEPENRRDPRQEQVAQISRRLKFLARELDVPVVALAQLNRGVEDRMEQKPRLSDLRESGAIEQDADVVILMHRPDSREGGGNKIELIIAKQRNGPTGEVSLAYAKEFMRFDNYAIADNIPL